MPYIALIIGEKIEGAGFETEAEARAYCRKHDYKSTMYAIFEGTFDSAIENGQPPIALYLWGKGYNVTPLEGKDVPYTTFRVRKDKIPSADGFVAFVLETDEDYANSHRAIEQAFADGAKLVWEITSDPIWVKVFKEPRSAMILREGGTLDGGDVIPDFQLPIADLFEEIVVE